MHKINNYRKPKPERLQKKIAPYFLRRNKQRPDALFADFKKKRKEYLNKLVKPISPDKSHFGEHSEEEYRNLMMVGYKKFLGQLKPKERHEYLNEVWNPKMSMSGIQPFPKHKKNVRNIRYNARRNRIESDSESSETTDDEQVLNEKKAIEEFNFIENSEIYSLNLENSTKPVKTKPNKKSSPKQTNLFQSVSKSTQTDSEVSPQILEPIKISNMNRKHLKFNKPSLTPPHRDHTKNILNERLKISNKQLTKKTGEDLSPFFSTVQQGLRRGMAKTERKEKECKLCKSLFPSHNERDTMCIICKDTVKIQQSRLSISKSKKNQKSRSKVFKATSKNKIFEKMQKCEQDRLLYHSRAGEQKQYHHCKSFITPRDLI